MQIFRKLPLPLLRRCPFFAGATGSLSAIVFRSLNRLFSRTALMIVCSPLCMASSEGTFYSSNFTQITSCLPVNNIERPSATQLNTGKLDENSRFQPCPCSLVEATCSFNSRGLESLEWALFMVCFGDHLLTLEHDLV